LDTLSYILTDDVWTFALACTQPLLSQHNNLHLHVFHRSVYYPENKIHSKNCNVFNTIFNNEIKFVVRVSIRFEIIIYFVQ